MNDSVSSRWGVLLCVIVLGCLLSGCASTRSQWENASSENTVGAYQYFLQNHPNSQYAAQARHRIEQLKYDRAMAETSAQGKMRDLRTFVKQYPGGALTQKARFELSRLSAERLKAEFDAAVRKGRYSALLAFRKNHPGSPYGAQLKEQMGKYVLRTVPDGGFVLWKREAQKTSSEDGLHIKVHAEVVPLAEAEKTQMALTSLMDEGAAHLGFSGMFSQFSNSIYDEYIKEVSDKPEKGYGLWALMAESTADYVELDGNIQIMNGVGGYSGSAAPFFSYKNGELKLSGGNAKQLHTFIFASKKGLLEFRPLVYITPDRHLNGFSAFVDIGAMTPSGRLTGRFLSVAPTQAQIVGELRLGKQVWIPIRSDMEAEDGAIMLSKDRIWLRRGTRIVTKRGD